MSSRSTLRRCPGVVPGNFAVISIYQFLTVRIRFLPLCFTIGVCCAALTIEARADTHTESYTVDGHDEISGGVYRSETDYLIVSGTGSPIFTFLNVARHDPTYFGTIIAGNADGEFGDIRVLSGSILEGGIDDGAVYIGRDLGSTGILTVNGEYDRGILPDPDDNRYWRSRFRGDTTIIGESGQGSFNVLNGARADVGELYLGLDSTGHGTLSVSGSGVAHLSSIYTGSAFVGHFGTGVVSITSEGLFDSSRVSIGTMEGSSGTVTTSGIGSSFAASDLVIGGDGLGNLLIENGASAQSSIGSIGGYFGDNYFLETLGTGFGSVTVRDLGSVWECEQFLDVGWNGFAELNIEGGGKVRSGISSVGVQDIAYGDVTVRGDGSMWEASSLRVGESGFGAVTVLDGGLVSFESGSIGTQSGSTGVVTIKGHGSQGRSEMIQTSDYLFFVGDSGTGYLTIDDGARLRTMGGTVIAGDGQGTVEVKGASGGYRSTWLNSGDLEIGVFGNGNLAIENGGLVSTGGSTDIGGYFDAHGLVEVSGVFGQFRSTLEVSEAIRVGSGEGGSGSLSVGSGGLVNSVGRSRIDGSGQTTATIGGTTGEYVSTWNNAGLLTVGEFALGTLSIEDGGLVQNQSSIVGDWKDSEGTVFVKGVSGIQRATWNNSLNNLGGLLTVGNSGNGTLRIENGGLVESIVGLIGFEDFGIGTVAVNGQENSHRSTWNSSNALVVGYHGEGSLFIEIGGLVQSMQGRIGFAESGRGSVSVRGTDGDFRSTWQNALDLTVGESGTGELNIEAGGSVISQNGIIGRNASANGTVTVTGSNSIWETGFLDVGESGTGTLNIEIGGRVISSGGGSIGSFESGHGTVTVTGSGSSWHSADLTAGELGTGVIKVEAGGSVSSQRGYIGRAIGSNGIATISGNGSTWSGSDLFVGYDGAGEANIEAGGDATFFSSYIGRNADSSGTATVTGSDSNWSNTWSLDVGYEGIGHLNIQDGGRVSSTQGSIGRNPNSHGTVTVTGSNSLWTGSNNTLFVGYAGTGELRIEAGGSVSSGVAYIGRESDSSGTTTVSGNESNWTNYYFDFIIGDSGTGYLNIEGGGRVTSSGGIVGRYAGSVGTVSVSGGNSTWNNWLQDIVVGDSGTGLLFFQNGGTVFNKTGFVGRFEDSFGSVLVAGSGSTWANSEKLIVGGSSLTTGTTTGVGVLNVFEDGLVTVGETLRIHKNGTVNLQTGGSLVAQDIVNSGWLNGVGSVAGNVVNDGIVAPGNSPGKLLIDGDFRQLAEGQLQIEFTGRNAGTEYDQLFVSGKATLEGMFLFHFLDGFAPVQGDTFDFLVASHVQVSSQIQVQIENLLPGFEYDLSVIDGAYRLTALNNATFVPEPGSAALMILSAVALAIARRRNSEA